MSSSFSLNSDSNEDIPPPVSSLKRLRYSTTITNIDDDDHNDNSNNNSAIGSCDTMGITTNCSSYATKMKTNDDGDDDDVEILFTIPAETSHPIHKNHDDDDDYDNDASVTHSTTMNEQRRRQQQCLVENLNHGIEIHEQMIQTNISNNDILLSTTTIDCTSTVVENIPNDVNHSNNTTMHSTHHTMYPIQSSAYVQNLAEICYTILYDRRWQMYRRRRCRRTQQQPPSQIHTNKYHHHDENDTNVATIYQSLFQWEHGDEMNVVIAFSRLYIPIPKPSISLMNCTCLLCKYTNTKKQQTNQNIDCHHHNNNDNNNTDHQKSPFINDRNVDEINNNTLDDRDHTDHHQNSINTPYIRRLYLYSRLFYRKGPWFRIDDIYHRYYKITTSSTTTSVPPSSSTNDTTMVSDQEQNIIQLHIQQVQYMLQDVHELYQSGMIRYFDHEQECGKVIGSTTDGLLLNQEEQNYILTKLGAAPNHKPSKKRLSINHSSIHENKIWKQMNQQQSIFTMNNTSNNSTTNRTVLPVRRHVEFVILEKLIKYIIQSITGSSINQLSSTRYKELHILVKKSLIQLLLQYQSHTHGLLQYDGCCFTLSDGPKLTLQRCCRLYLCATSGPCSMRSNGTNGWQSVQSIPNIYMKNAPLGTTIIPPGQHMWHKVNYPGLSYRFGLMSASFMNSYQVLPINEEDYTISMDIPEQVFLSFQDFYYWEVCAELRCYVDYIFVLNDAIRSDERRRARGKESKYTKNGSNTTNGSSIDSRMYLSTNGRQRFLRIFLCVSEYIDEIEQDVAIALTSVESECEQVLIVIAIMVTYILNTCSIHHEMMRNRPWLRHLSWMACLALILYDIVPIVERRGLYQLAVRSFQVLLFGSYQTRTNDLTELMSILIRQQQFTVHPSWISRRTRGKVMERLLVDCGQLHRQYTASKSKPEKRKFSDDFRKLVLKLCKEFVMDAAASGCIGFSAVRTLARRLKQPLYDTLNQTACIEANELGLRLVNSMNSESTKTCKNNSVSNWTAPSDYFVANSIVKNSNEPGSRCSFVGFEDDVELSLISSSLNVEELAMDLYNSGRLPLSECGEDLTINGGWIGWHDEGSHLRALYRIICGAPILGMDFGHRIQRNDNCEEGRDVATIFLSPYQQAPFDLFVGYELQNITTCTSDNYQIASRNFYYRRADSISRFLNILENLNDQEISDLVYDSIEIRLSYSKQSKFKDPVLERDISQVQTLSAIAAGFGGRYLAATFRCLFFDYRHYSGGLPDLTLFRAIYTCDSGTHKLVDLRTWIGESLSEENAYALKNASKFLGDENGEFLGFDISTDSGIRTRNSNGFAASLLKATGLRNQSNSQFCDMMPPRLNLSIDSFKVKVECMVVEVKSSNDRLDARQEDWLNIMDKHGDARVCKFVDNKMELRNDGCDA